MGSPDKHARPMRVCTKQGCITLTQAKDGRCDKHPKAWAKGAQTYQRESGRALQRKREALFSAEPLCRQCRAVGLVTAAVVRDHITPLGEGGQDILDNTQPLCKACHDAKTAEEAKRGLTRTASTM